MRFKPRRISIPVLAVSVALTLASCGGGSDTESSSGAKELRVAVALGDLSTLDAARGFSDANQVSLPLYSDTLVRISPDDPTKLSPGLATKWEASTDLKTYTFTLRDDATFPSGRAMTAEDVKYSFERLFNLQGPPAFLAAGITSITPIDDHTVEFKLDTADATFPIRLTANYLTVLDAKELAKNGGVSDKTAVKADKSQAYLDKTTIGTGPYRLKKWDRNSQVVFEANPDYWGDKPKYQRIVLKDVRETATQAQLVQRGDVDIATNIDPDTAKSLEGKSGIEITKDQSLNQVYLAINNKAPGVPELADVKVRQAIQAAIDYDGISKAFGDGASRAASMVPLGLEGADKVDPAPYDVSKAKSLLKSAGVSKLDFDVEFANVVWYGVPQSALWQKIKSDLAAVNITIKLKPVEYEKWIDDYRAYKHTITTGLYAPDYSSAALFLDVIGRPAGIYSDRLHTKVAGGEEEFQKYLSTSDEAARVGVATTFIEQLRDNASITPIVQPNSIVVHSDKISGVGYSRQNIVSLTTAQAK